MEKTEHDITHTYKSLRIQTLVSSSLHCSSHKRYKTPNCAQFFGKPNKQTYEPDANGQKLRFLWHSVYGDKHAAKCRELQLETNKDDMSYYTLMEQQKQQYNGSRNLKKTKLKQTITMNKNQILVNKTFSMSSLKC